MSIYKLQTESKSTITPFLVSKTEAAKSLGVSERTLERHLKDYGIPYVRFGDRVLFSPKALEAWVDGQCKMSQPKDANSEEGALIDGKTQLD
tara:strand:+ start:81 stop:356 length:276 start_codon:yes stop_codon:yes gene_type:complete